MIIKCLIPPYRKAPSRIVLFETKYTSCRLYATQMGEVVLSMKGFTLIELMVTLAVLVILLTIGIPSFNAIIRESRLKAQANELLGTMVAARSEAAKRNEPVYVKAAGGEWAEGWQLLNLDDDVLHTYRALRGGNSLVCAGDCEQVVFLGSGSADLAETFTLCDQGGEHGRIIEVLNSGKTRIANGGGAC